MSLTFDMYSPIIDTYTGEKIDNPYIGSLQSESKIKLKYNGEWFDFILKEITENSEQHKYSYSCIGLAQNELSKTGYNLNFDIELENNIDTIEQLANKVLENTNWVIGSDSDSLIELQEEPLYKGVLRKGITVSKTPGEGGITIPSDNEIYIFYSDYNSDQMPYGGYQLIWVEGNKYITNDNGLILNSDCNYFFNGDIKSALKQITVNEDLIVVQVSNEYRGNKKIYSPETVYSPVLKRVVNKVTSGNDSVARMYTESEYTTSELVQNIISPNKDFTYTAGWSIENGRIILKTYPDILNDFSWENTYLSCIEAYPENGESFLYNTSINSYFKTNKDTYYIGKKWRIKIWDKNGENITTLPKIELISYISTLKENTILGELKQDSKGYYIESITQYPEQENAKFALRFTLSNNLIISQIEFYPIYILDNEEVTPGREIAGQVKTKYYIYSESNDLPEKNIEDLEYLYTGYDFENSGYRLIYDSDYTKKRSISGSKTNRLNLLQNIAEAFECWILFKIEHDTDGFITEKKVEFKEYNQVDNYAGFKYGINLSSIQRKIDSSAICTKLIVEDNVTDLAENGFCSIANASENDLKENFLINFDYYINKGILNAAVVNNDIYGAEGLYTKIREENKEKEADSRKLATLIGATIPQLTATITTLEELISSSEAEFNESNRELKELTGKDYFDYKKDNSYPEMDLAKQALIKCKQFIESKETATSDYEKIQKELTDANSQIDTISENITKRAENIKQILADFEKKYSQYIQEGAWTSSNYIDNNLYYYDALSTLRTSSRPKITYTINVVDISTIEGYEYYNFNPGDKTYIEDAEFFGKGYKEEVIVQEVKRNLSDQSKTTISVKNYKTEFDDLFQRVNSIATQVQFSTGKYMQAASAFDENGNIKYDVVDNALANNDFIISNSSNNSVTWNSSGITAINLNNVNEMVRIVGGGILLTNDGGNTWSTGITGAGINANYITSGRIDTNLIQIMNNGFPSFKWDKDGLNAYEFTIDEDSGSPITYDPNNFIRFNRFGIFGSRPNDSNLTYNSIEEVQANSAFSLTRKGLRYNDSSGSPTLQANKDGNLEIVGKIRILKLDDSAEKIVVIGPGDEQKESIDESGNKIYTYQVFNACDNFIVYNDGTIEATRGKFTGEITAISGTFSGTLEAATGSFNGEITADSGRIGLVQINEEGLRIPNEDNSSQITINSSGIIGSKTNELGEEESFFSVTPEGNVSITGVINAIGGFFSGEINANSGIIGGFKIENEKLTSLKMITENEEQMPSITLDGTNGEIIANFIQLGTGAVVKDYISFTDDEKTSYIYNPTYHNGTFIESNGIKINVNGTATFGSIRVDGIKSTISGNNWNITPDAASFNHVVAKGGTIENVVFENQSVQSVGGYMLFRPSLKANTIFKDEVEKEWILYFDDGSDYFSFLDNDYILLSAKGQSCYGQIIEINKEENYFRIIPNKIEDFDLSFDKISEIIITKLASVIETEDGKQLTDQLLIGVNPHLINNNINKDLGALYREGITFIKPELIRGPQESEVAEPGNQEEKYVLSYPDTLPELFMGNLSSLQSNSSKWPTMSGYGLFANNVYLKGALITELSDGYAGINTNSKASFNKTNIYPELKEDTSEIVIWAGANSLDNINEAPFQVTKKGTIYASQGLFEGSIISKSTIEASKIITAEIIGNGYDSDTNNPALLVTDATQGILFKARNNGDNNTGFKVTYNNTELSNSQYLLSLKDEESQKGLELSSWGQIRGNSGALIELDKKVEINNSIQIDNNDVGLLNQVPLNLNESSIYFKKEEVEMLPSYNTNNKVIGYDLYIF